MMHALSAAAIVTGTICTFVVMMFCLVAIIILIDLRRPVSAAASAVGAVVSLFCCALIVALAYGAPL